MRLDPERLRQATDRLNEAFRDLEEVLQGVNPGVEAEVAFPESDHSLCWKKHRNSFHLLVAEGQHMIPLTAASREIRLQAVPLLEDLYQELKVVTQEEMERINKAIEMLEAFTRQLSKGEA